MKIQLLSTILAINSILILAGSAFALPTANRESDTAALSRAIAQSIDFADDDAIALVHIAIDRALVAKQMAASMTTIDDVKNVSPPVLVTAGVPRLPQPTPAKP